MALANRLASGASIASSWPVCTATIHIPDPWLPTVCLPQIVWSLILLCSHSPLVKLIKKFMPHAATQRCVSCLGNRSSMDDMDMHSTASSIQHLCAALAVAPLRRFTVPLARLLRAWALRLVGGVALALKLCPSFLSDFLWFWVFCGETTKLAAKLHLLRLTTTTYKAAGAALWPGQARPDQDQDQVQVQVQSSLETGAQTACEVFNKFVLSCLMPKCSYIFDFICFDQ